MTRKPLTLERKIRRTGQLFLLPWLFGVITFFVIPFFTTVIWSFQSVDLVNKNNVFIGLKNYDYIIYKMPGGNFLRSILTSMSDTLSNVAIILIFSFFIALILNQKFHGRGIARALFFLPVIVASSIVINIIRSDVFTNNLMRGSDVSMFQTGSIGSILQEVNMPQGFINALTNTLADIFDLTWKTGMQIILFLSGLQAIPDSYYEVSSIEGANAWDAFWKITAPMVTPSIMLVIVYTIIDTFTNHQNAIMNIMLSEMRNKIQYDRASAMAMLLFLVVGAIIGFVMFCMRKVVFYNE